MNKIELDKIVENHGKWLNNDDGERADLSGANLHGANLRSAILRGADLSSAILSSADLSYAYLRGADLRGAILHGADLRSAILSGADLSSADLSSADLRDADLSGADLSSADLRYTVLNPEITKRNREIAKGRPGYIVYRSVKSQYVSDTVYELGKTYVAPVMSWCPVTECHPGIYFCWTMEQYRDHYGLLPAVRCYVRDGEWLAVNKGGRAARLRVLSEVDDE